MNFERASGILLHPTSLPGRFGIGDLGQEAYNFVHFLQSAGQHLWQIMPLGPTGYGDSPYASFSAFAGNPLLISPDKLIAEGLLPENALAELPSFPINFIDYGWVIHVKFKLLQTSFNHFKKRQPTSIIEEFQQFCQRNSKWLDEFALFMAIKHLFPNGAWTQWPAELAARRPQALQEKRIQLAEKIEAQKYFQFLFFRQWFALKNYANAHNIQIIGDLPIFAAQDSADVWSLPELFYLSETGEPTVVAGVPPDYFSETGQRWGNPLYRWDMLKKQNYGWWADRMNQILKLVDIIRIDHFRGFEAYWEVPADKKTAVIGRWVKGPGAELFLAIEQSMGKLPPIIAEDLGIITAEVEALRDQFGFPGMRVLQFAFTDGAKNRDLPHNYPRNSVVYTGTHDNDTTTGWYLNSSTEHERDYFRSYLARDGHDACWDMIRLCFSSAANTGQPTAFT